MAMRRLVLRSSFAYADSRCESSKVRSTGAVGTFHRQPGRERPNLDSPTTEGPWKARKRAAGAFPGMTCTSLAVDGKLFHWHPTGAPYRHQAVRVPRVVLVSQYGHWTTRPRSGPRFSLGRKQYLRA